ncbi:TPR-like protein [Annulohypoxylon maeteangense]|uniref:TPR-like protein n=1 Tax=Annulohypoxylon maeteangense TaxID=1927788 RepID=UPI0020089C81|nr:TPR-like protein [Annulohypoxylon maeteangense]KAI0890500.1 TPR-like protein [Annulohypoxylon maeteangense]
MSFLGGPECSTAGNPLSQFTKHTQDDNTLQRDRLRNGTPQGGMGGFRTAAQHGPQDEMMNSFLQQNGQLPNMPLEGMNQIRLDHPAHGVHLRANSTSPSWANEFQHNPQAAMESAFKVPQGTQFGPEDYAKFQRMTGQANSSRASPMPSAMQYQNPMMGMGMMNGMSMNYGMGGMAMHPMAARQQFQERTSQDKGKGKEKVVELDDQQWEEQFKQLELQENVTKDVDEAAALEPELNKLDEQILESETNEFGDFESIWRGIRAEEAAGKEMLDEEEWVEQVADPADWSDRFGDWSMPGANSRLMMDPEIENYLFEEDNLFKNTGNPFEEGMRIVDGGGNLSLAALAFEAAAQKDPTHVEAWVQLGMAQAQNEKETAAIRALEQAKNLDPNNAPALMTLAVSYTNEGYDSIAYRTLERWLSIRYPSVIAPGDLSNPAELGFTERQQLHDRVTNHFIKAARLSPDGEHMDPDVQVGLGVLFYGAEEYDKAVDCFSAALASTELGASNRQGQVHLLWNRLGATLANSGKSEDAIAAYEKALTLRPNFVRARYNLGVSCINMGCHAEAAGHLLAALGMHKTVEKEGREKARELLGGDVSDAQLDAMTTQNRSTNLYDTLRRVFTQMGRRDLAEKVLPGVDPEVFRGDIEF